MITMKVLLQRIFWPLLLLASLAFAQSETSADLNTPPMPFSPQGVTPRGETFRKNVDEVSLVFSVRDRHGRFINDLALHDIDLRDDNQLPLQICSFQAQSELPLRIALLLDVSNSIDRRFDFEKNSALEFLRNTLRPGSDLVFVVAFNEAAHIAQDWTDDATQIERSMQGLRLGGGTAFYDAVGFAARKLAAEHQSVRRLIVVISDGQDNSSKHSPKQAMEQALWAEAAVYSLNTNVVPAHLEESTPELIGEQSLRRIAMGTGGYPLQAENGRSIAKAFALLQKEIRSQYVLTYKPAAFQADGHYRKIKLQSQNRGGLRFSVRPGYYALLASNLTTSDP
jgi:Ca-activated chloride channel homolog